jgi:hypothetical protein
MRKPEPPVAGGGAALGAAAGCCGAEFSIGGESSTYGS